jgi:hypothetical protein
MSTQSAGVGTDHFVAHAPGELEVAPDGDPFGARPRDHWMVRCESGRGDHDVGAEVHEGCGYRVQRPLPERRADHRQQPGVLLRRGLGDHEHVGAEFGEGVGDREARHRQPEDGDLEPLPVGVPAGQVGETVAHSAAIQPT